MLDDLPEEILTVIMNHSCQRPKDYMNFKLINQRSSFIVGNLEHLFINDGNQYEEELDELCRRDTSLKTIDWYFKNDVTFTLKNVKRLIINNRIDILQHGLKYHHFLELLFNRFYMNVDSQNDIFSIVESLNPLMVAAENNHIFIDTTSHFCFLCGNCVHQLSQLYFTARQHFRQNNIRLSDLLFE